MRSVDQIVALTDEFNMATPCHTTESVGTLCVGIWKGTQDYLTNEVKTASNPAHQRKFHVGL